MAIKTTKLKEEIVLSLETFVREEGNGANHFIWCLTLFPQEEAKKIKAVSQTQINIPGIRITDCLEASTHPSNSISLQYKRWDKEVHEKIKKLIMEAVMRGDVDELFPNSSNLLREAIKDITPERWIELAHKAITTLLGNTKEGITI